MNEAGHKNSTGGYPQAELEAIGVGTGYSQWVLSGFRPWLKGAVCEVGAGVGNISQRLAAYDLKQLVLLEPDRPLFETLKQKMAESPNVCISNGTLTEYTAENEAQFDAFLYINVLEHIEQDEQELRLMYSRLRPGGAALIFVPALSALFSGYDRRVGHWRRYSKKELRDKIKRAGFDLLDIRYFDFVGAFIWFVACRLLGLWPSAGKVGLYDRILVPFSSRIERLLPPVLGKNLLAVAIKK